VPGDDDLAGDVLLLTGVKSPCCSNSVMYSSPGPHSTLGSSSSSSSRHSPVIPHQPHRHRKPQKSAGNAHQVHSPAGRGMTLQTAPGGAARASSAAMMTGMADASDAALGTESGSVTVRTAAAAANSSSSSSRTTSGGWQRGAAGPGSSSGRGITAGSSSSGRRTPVFL
jgi:hypothetical protein